MSDEISGKDKIAYLFEEYRALRNEVVARTGFGFPSVAALVAVGTWLTQQAKHTLADWLSLVAALLILAVGCLFFRSNYREIWHAGQRLKELEREINSRAGEHLLVWEQLYGAARFSFWRSLFASLTPLPRTALPPLDDRFRPKP